VVNVFYDHSYFLFTVPRIQIKPLLAALFVFRDTEYITSIYSNVSVSPGILAPVVSTILMELVTAVNVAAEEAV
jgi:hypothetical protein